MDIASRLKNIEARKRQPSKIVEEARAGLIDSVGIASEVLGEPKPRVERPIPALPEGFAHEEGPRGRVLRREVFLPQDGLGLALPVKLADLAHPRLAVDHVLPHLTADFPEVPKAAVLPEGVAFIDTETTGLAGGAGTVAFLVGIASWVRDDAGSCRLRLEQFLIEDFEHEEEMLTRVMASLSKFSAVCHYNGRTFDMPVLRARCILNRMRPRAFSLPQIDLLPVARRLWKGDLPSCSLKEIERSILLMHRGPDIDGAEIPLVFYEFARGLGAERMEHVLRHNAQDIASLAALFVHLSWCFLEPESDRLARSREFEGLARHFEKRGDSPRAARLFERAIELAPDRAREEALLLRLATLRRRNSEWDHALRVWRGLLDGGLTTAHEATIAIAKHLEHRARDYAGALATVRKFERTLELQQELEDLTGRPGGASLILRLHGDELRARRERLERKVQGASG